jgi:hypothetical protein
MMDENGPDWCEENLETIVGWLQEEAKRRKLPFVRTGARLLVRYAIRRARKKLKMLESQQTEQSQFAESVKAIVQPGHKLHIPDPDAPLL